MKFKLFFVFLLLAMTYSQRILADDGLNISYKAPFIPLEFTFSKSGIEISGSKSIITPIGSFEIGYSQYAAEFKKDHNENFTYVIIKDMNSMKEHIYQIKDKQKLRLVSKGVTNVNIIKNKVEIIVEKGSEFKLAFAVEGDKESNNIELNKDTKKEGVSLLDARIVKLEAVKEIWKIHEKATAKLVIENNTNEEKKGTLKINLVDSKDDYDISREVAIPPNSKKTFTIINLYLSETGKVELIIETKHNKEIIEITVIGEHMANENIWSPQSTLSGKDPIKTFKAQNLCLLVQQPMLMSLPETPVLSRRSPAGKLLDNAGV